MKRFIIWILLVVAFGAYTNAQTQFRNSELGWGLSVGGAHGTNDNNDAWMMQYRGFLQYELISPMLIGQLGLGYTELKSPGVYTAETGIVDLRLLFSPFSLPNLNPYLYGGFGVSKSLNSTGSDLLAMVPLGAGIQTRIASGVLLDINTGYNLSLSDKLDGRARSNTYLNSLTNQKHDGYFGVTVGLAFTLGSGYDKDEEMKKKELADAEARRVKADEAAWHKRELANAETRRVQDSTNTALKAARVKDANIAEVRHVKDSTGAVAEALRVKGANVAEMQRVKDSTASEAQRVKQLSDAEALRLAEQKSRDTVIVFVKGKTVVLRGINFEFNKATLTKDSEIILWRAYNAMVANSNVRVVITGHTDNVGSQKSNQDLSLKRAQAVKNWLVSKGTSSNRMITVGRGQNEPLASNETADGRAENRRMEFFVQ